MKKITYVFLLFVTLTGCKSPVSDRVQLTQFPITTNTTPEPTYMVPPTDEEEKLIPWKSLVGKTTYNWNGKEFLVSRSRSETYRMFDSIWREDVAEMAISDKKCAKTLNSYFLPLSVVGDLVSFQHEIGYMCGASAWYSWRFETRNVLRPNEQVALTDYFSDEEILRAFLANSRISAEIEKAKSKKRLDVDPSSLKQLTSFLTKFDYEIFDAQSYLEEDYLSRFAFHHINNDQICVRVTLTPTSHAGQAIQEYVEICLPMPKSIDEGLRNADSGLAGFLMKNYTTKVGTKTVVFEGRD